MSQLVINGSASIGNALQSLLNADDIVPGAMPSWQLCRTIYLYHPLGGKMVDAPLNLMQSQQRDVAVPAGPEAVKEAFLAKWKELGCDDLVKNTMRQARIYGIGSLAVVSDQIPSTEPFDPAKLGKIKFAFNVLDPLNTAGSLVLNQDPNATDFLKPKGIAINGRPYHPTRTITVMNEDPIYIAYTTSAYGYVGRSVYQRALFPLKSFIGTMVTDDMVSVKAGLIIAKLKQAGSIINEAMKRMFAIKRNLLKEAVVGNVLSISTDEEVESLNLQNLDGASKNARSNILKNTATAADMPAVFLENETLTEGFGEGTEDAKNIAHYIDGLRTQSAKLYAFLDVVCMHLAWDEEFFESVKASVPEYSGQSYQRVFQDWKNSFTAVWPSLLKEPESEQVKVSDVKLKALIAAIEVMLPDLDPENKAILFEWFQDNINSDKIMFPTPLQLEFDKLRAYTPPAEQQAEEPEAAPPFSARDSDSPAARRERILAGYLRAHHGLPDHQRPRLASVN